MKKLVTVLTLILLISLTTAQTDCTPVFSPDEYCLNSLPPGFTRTGGTLDNSLPSPCSPNGVFWIRQDNSPIEITTATAPPTLLPGTYFISASYLRNEPESMTLGQQEENFQIRCGKNTYNFADPNEPQSDFTWSKKVLCTLAPGDKIIFKGTGADSVEFEKIKIESCQIGTTAEADLEKMPFFTLFNALAAAALILVIYLFYSTTINKKQTKPKKK